MLRRLLESCYNSGPTTAQGSTTKRRQSEKWILERVGSSNGYEYKTAECRKTINAPEEGLLKEELRRVLRASQIRHTIIQPKSSNGTDETVNNLAKRLHC